MMELIRRYKTFYAIYNFFHKKQLIHNVPLFKKYGISKAYFQSVSSKDFQELDQKHIDWDPEGVKNTRIFKDSDMEVRQSILNFEENGFIIIPGYLHPEKVDGINGDIEGLLNRGIVKSGHRNKIMFAIKHSQVLRDVAKNADLLDLLGKLFGDEAILFSSINFSAGSEQATHSDSIHMTTYPSGGLLGVWIALEDITEDNGPLHYYPGSHKLPYYLNADYDNEGNAFRLGAKDYSEYEKMIEGKIENLQLKKKVFLAKKGDLLIWHANLFHGGEAQKVKYLSRKSVVFHYFRKNSICYHEITQRPALIKQY